MVVHAHIYIHADRNVFCSSFCNTPFLQCILIFLLNTIPRVVSCDQYFAATGFFIAASYFILHLKAWEKVIPLRAGIKIPILSVNFLRKRSLENSFINLWYGDETVKEKMK